MRIYPIQNGRAGCSAFKTNKWSQHHDNRLVQMKESFVLKSNTLKGAGIGAVVGLCSIAFLSLISGGLATPLAYGLYAAAFGTAGGFTGKALDDLEKEESGHLSLNA